MKTLRQVRKERGVTKAAMARYLGISKPTYDVYENNPERMRVETARKAANYLGVDISDIFFYPKCK